MIRTDLSYIISHLPPRRADGNKSTFGRALLICGSDTMRGAALLSVRGALRTGAGLVTLAAPQKVLDALCTALPEALTFPAQGDVRGKSAEMQAIALGPGIGRENTRAAELLRDLLTSDGAPLVLDADGLNLLAEDISLLRSKRRKVLLTPHPLEFSRLTGLSVDAIQSARAKVAADFAKDFDVTLLLKGRGTVITDGVQIFENPTGNTALAKGGSGDVLTGIITSFLAQGVPPLDAAVIGAYLHGLAAERLSARYSEYGVLASEVADEVARLLAEITTSEKETTHARI